MRAKRGRSALLDTGANHSMFHRDVEPFMRNAKKSKMNVQVASGDMTHGIMDGGVRMKTDGESITEQGTTMGDLPIELYSVDNKYYQEN
jgi:hypothetical protein